MSIYVAPRRSILPVVVESVKAGPIGPGAGPLQTEFPLRLLLNRGTPQQNMRRWLEIAKQAGWPDAAENAIATAILRQEWTLEDPEEVEIDDAYPDSLARMAFELMDKPMAALKEDEGAKYTRPELWRLTFRHVGICGSSFWFKNSPNLYGWPESIKYLAPWRMDPNEDANGNLKSWQIDRTPTSPGIEVSLEQLVHFMLYPPDYGHFGRSQLEIALLKAQNSHGFDVHISHVLAAGGRLSGLLSPKQGDSVNNEQFNQLVADARTIVEQPDAAKRLQVMRGPMEFTQTTMTIADLALVDLLKLYRDDTLSLWGVPPGYLVSTPGGLASGEARKLDKQVMWENAAHSRVAIFREAVQQNIIDLWQKADVTLDFEIEEPSFDDDSARFDLLGKSINAPLRNRERRALVGLEPFGDAVLNPQTSVPLDDEVWLPNSQVLVYSAPEEGVAVVPAPAPVQAPVPEQNDRASSAAGEAPTPTKATLRSIQGSLRTLRKTLDARFTPRVKDAVQKVLEEQKTELIHRAKGSAEHLMKNRGKDLAFLWDAEKWDRRMREALQPHLIGMAETLDTHVKMGLDRPVKASVISAVDNTIRRGKTRVTGLNRRTRDRIESAIQTVVNEAIAEGLSPAEAGDRLEAAINAVTLENGEPAFSELRAETIARTEVAQAYNDATLGSYRDMDVAQVEVIDGDDFDEACAEANGQIWSIDEADGRELEHPNCTRDFLPVVPDEEPIEEPAKAEVVQVVKAEPPEPARLQLEVIKTEAPIVNVPAPVVYVAAPQVSVEPPDVSSFTEAIYELKALLTRPKRRTLIRDTSGRVMAIEEE